MDRGNVRRQENSKDFYQVIAVSPVSPFMNELQAPGSWNSLTAYFRGIYTGYNANISGLLP